jgi:hypothetical protein
VRFTTYNIIVCYVHTFKKIEAPKLLVNLTLFLIENEIVPNLRLPQLAAISNLRPFISA